MADNEQRLELSFEETSSIYVYDLDLSSIVTSYAAIHNMITYNRINVHNPNRFNSGEDIIVCATLTQVNFSISKND